MTALRADAIRQVAKLMAASAITAPKSGGQRFNAGKHLFIETVIVDDRETLGLLAGWMRARGSERRENIWSTVSGSHFPRLSCWTSTARCLPSSARVTSRSGRMVSRNPEPGAAPELERGSHQHVPTIVD